MYADKRANAKPSPNREGDIVLLRQEKKNKLSTLFEGIPYTVFQKKGSMVTAERTTDGRMVTRNTKDFKSCPPSSKETTQATLADKADDAIVAAKPPSTVDVAEQTSEMPVTTNKCCALTSSALVLKNRDTREERDINLHDLKTTCADRDIKIHHSGTLKELSLPVTRNIERDRICLFIL